jgi:two-component response regulator (ARR-B family)
MRTEERNGVAGSGRDQFPVGMRVLAVDDDPVCLKVLETLLRRCQYHGEKSFTTCSSGL